MALNIYFRLSHFPRTPHTFILITYLKTPFGYLIYILNLTCLKPNSLFLSQMYFTCSFPYLGRCQQCFQSVQIRKFTAILHSLLYSIPHTNTADHSFGSAFKIYLNRPLCFIFSFSSWLKPLSFLAWVIAIAFTLTSFGLQLSHIVSLLFSNLRNNVKVHGKSCRPRVPGSL